MVRPSLAAVFGATVGAGFSDATGCFTGRIGNGSINERVAGLVLEPPPLGLRPQARELNPFLVTRYPALVSRPILNRSRRVRPAAISSRRFFLALSKSLLFGIAPSFLIF